MEDRIHLHGVTCQSILDAHFPKAEIFDSNKWKNDFRFLDVDSVKNMAKDLQSIEGIIRVGFGFSEPSPFLCLLTRCVQGYFDQKDMEEFIWKEESVYLPALGAFFMRLLENRPSKLNWYLKPLFKDRRDINIIDKTGKSQIMRISTFAKLLMTERTLCDVTLPQIQVYQVSLNREMRARETTPTQSVWERLGNKDHRRENVASPSRHDRERHDIRDLRDKLVSNERRRAEDSACCSDHHRGRCDGKNRAGNQHGQREYGRNSPPHNAERSVNRDRQHAEQRRDHRQDGRSRNDRDTHDSKDRGLVESRRDHRQDGGSRSRNNREPHDNKDRGLIDSRRADDRTHSRPRIEIRPSGSRSGDLRSRLSHVRPVDESGIKEEFSVNFDYE